MAGSAPAPAASLQEHNHEPTGHAEEHRRPEDPQEAAPDGAAAALPGARGQQAQGGEAGDCDAHAGRHHPRRPEGQPVERTRGRGLLVAGTRLRGVGLGQEAPSREPVEELVVLAVPVPQVCAGALAQVAEAVVLGRGAVVLGDVGIGLLSQAVPRCQHVDQALVVLLHVLKAADKSVRAHAVFEILEATPIVGQTPHDVLDAVHRFAG
mmetsp:Transcript_94325/g.245622  ORF Transcript_94325/g.245622 Transcript_94325/m.245622 type:complete len:209 (+) Transcript_94325:545-1171(+)